MDSTVLAEALKSLHFGKGRLGSLGSEGSPSCIRVLQRPSWGGLWLVTSCSPLTLGSGVWGWGTADEDKNRSLFASRDWLSCPKWRPVCSCNWKTPPTRGMGGWLSQTPVWRPPAPHLRRWAGIESLTLVPFRFTDWFGCTDLEFNKQQQQQQKMPKFLRIRRGRRWLNKVLKHFIKNIYC